MHVEGTRVVTRFTNNEYDSTTNVSQFRGKTPEFHFEHFQPNISPCDKNKHKISNKMLIKVRGAYSTFELQLKL